MRQSNGAAQVVTPRGRPFPKGNSGRKAGSRNRTTLIQRALLDGDAEELLRTAVRLAKAGNVVLLKFFLERILPRDRLVQIDLPDLEFADDVVEAQGEIVSAVAQSTLSPREGADLGILVKNYADAIDLTDVAKRLDALEAKIIASDRESKLRDGLYR
jgi:hypothetical protein